MNLIFYSDSTFRACKTYFDHVDNKAKCDLPVEGVKAAIFEHFGLSDRFDIYLHYYEKFDKTFIASLCKRLAELAEKGDQGLDSVEFGQAFDQHFTGILQDGPCGLMGCFGLVR